MFIVPLIALLAGVLATVPAAAATSCQDEFDVLDAATQSVAITASKADKERAGPAQAGRGRRGAGRPGQDLRRRHEAG
jgi:hypothetical protein